MKKRAVRQWLLYVLQLFFAVGVTFSLLMLGLSANQSTPSFNGETFYESADFMKRFLMDTMLQVDRVNYEEAKRLFDSLSGDVPISTWVGHMGDGERIEYFTALKAAQGNDRRMLDISRKASSFVHHYSEDEWGMEDREVPMYRKKDLLQWLEEGVESDRLRFLIESSPVNNKPLYQPIEEDYEPEDGDFSGGYTEYIRVLREFVPPIGYESLLSFANNTQQDYVQMMDWTSWLLRADVLQEISVTSEPLSNVGYTITYGKTGQTYTNLTDEAFSGAKWSAEVRFTSEDLSLQIGKGELHDEFERSLKGQVSAAVLPPDTTVSLYLDQQLLIDDSIAEGAPIYAVAQQTFQWAAPVLFLCAAGWLTTLALFLYQTGRRQDGVLARLEKAIPTECYLLACALFCVLIVLWLSFTVEQIFYNPLALEGASALRFSLFNTTVPLLISITAILPESIGLYLLSALVRKIKWHRFYGGSILQWLVKWGQRFFTSFQESTHIYFRGAIAAVLIGLFNLIALFGWRSLLPAAVVDGIVLLWIIREEMERMKLLEEVRGLAAGEKEPRLQPEFYHGINREMAYELEKIDEGIDRAVQENMKNERMQTELITNVSHDIRTPLTSIINYIDLLKREKLNNEKAEEYLAILDKKSLRLKQLMNDLIEASRASAGAIEMEYVTINLVELLRQAIGEYEERWLERRLDAHLAVPEEGALVTADGRHLYRVLDNLFGNVLKYAMPATRVYIDVVALEDDIVLTVKNTSEVPLNIEADQLMERFKRGDEARSGEGSGLGLSIASNLTRLMGGRFAIHIDGDLFKVTIRLTRGSRAQGLSGTSHDCNPKTE
ncbi:MAG: HAMP domain-containing sensor histidine kinase [Ndongobacter sp.]|nr:HAMP domain-containing sensor histidine kinase [Ndongobacter sp.]